jgi:hypothetical protein
MSDFYVLRHGEVSGTKLDKSKVLFLGNADLSFSEDGQPCVFEVSDGRLFFMSVRHFRFTGNHENRWRETHYNGTVTVHGYKVVIPERDGLVPEVKPLEKVVFTFHNGDIVDCSNRGYMAFKNIKGVVSFHFLKALDFLKVLADRSANDTDYMRAEAANVEKVARFIDMIAEEGA